MLRRLPSFVDNIKQKQEVVHAQILRVDGFYQREFQEDSPMTEAEQKENYVELFDISRKAAIARAPLAKISHLPRVGERVFLPLHQPGDWEAYTIVAVEYFVGGQLSASGGPLEASGSLRVTLYAESN